MSTGTTTLAFQLPEGWTLRKVATAMAREWLPPFRAEPAAKAARWVVQSVMEAPDNGAAPLWEAGISTSEYEERLDSAELNWVIRASAGRGKSTILARFVLDKEHPERFQMVLVQPSFPDALFDVEKLDQLPEVNGTPGTAEVFSALLTSNGFALAAN
jgi:hypothetical protein